MKKIFKTIPFVAIVIAVFVSTSAMGAGTETNWKLSLKFKTGGAEDLMPVEVGTGSNAEELLKPPPLPGKKDTGNAEDAYVRGAIKTPTSGKQAAKVIDVANKNVWAIEVDAEESGLEVTVDIDTTDFYTSYYPITVVTPGSSTPVRDVFKAAEASNVSLFTSNGSPRTVYLIAGSSKSFVAASGEDSEIVGVAVTPGVGRMANTEVNLFSSPCGSSAARTVTTDENGLYTIDSVSAGAYVVQVKKPLHLGSECAITVDAQGASTSVCDPVYAGDFNSDEAVDLFDLAKVKPSYGKTSTSGEGWNADFDLNADNAIDIFDINIFKRGFGVENILSCGS